MTGSDDGPSSAISEMLTKMAVRFRIYSNPYHELSYRSAARIAEGLQVWIKRATELEQDVEDLRLENQKLHADIARRNRAETAGSGRKPRLKTIEGGLT